MIAILSKRIGSRGLHLVLMLVMALTLSGCFESKQEFTINPDGSGKVVHEAKFARVSMGMGDDERASLDEQLQTAVKELLSNSKGVEAWRDVSYRRLPDGRMYFKGTAYFRNLSQLNLFNQAAIHFRVEKQADGSLILDGVGAREGEEKTQGGAPAKLNEADLAQKIARRRAKFQESRPMLAGLTSILSQDVTLRLPGDIKTATNFQKAAGRALKVQFGGPKVLAAVDELSGNEEWWRKRVQADADDSGLGVDFDDLEMNAKLFGEKAPVRAVIAAGGQPQFDYAQEIGAAKREYAALTQRLGTKPGGNEEGALVRKPIGQEKARPLSPASPEGKPMSDVRVTGLRFVFDKKAVPLSFGRGSGLTLALQGYLPANILHASGGEILVAATADGTDLRSTSTAINLDQFSARQDDDRKVLQWELNIDLPPAKTSALKEVSGYIEYVAEGGTRKTNFGLSELKTGAEGTEFGARLESFEQPAGGRLGGLTLKLKVGPWRVKSLNFLDAAGQTLKVTKGSTSWSDLSTTYKYSWTEALPAGARIEAEVYDPLDKRRAPFRIEQVPMVGHP